MSWNSEVRTDAGEVSIYGDGNHVVLEVRGRVDQRVVTAIGAATDVALDAEHDVTVDLSHVAGAEPDAAAAMAAFLGTHPDELLVTGGTDLFGQQPSLAGP